MKTDRASDLHLTRELTERQRDQQWLDDQRTEYLRAAEHQPEPANPDWRG